MKASMRCIKCSKIICEILLPNHLEYNIKGSVRILVLQSFRFLFEFLFNHGVSIIWVVGVKCTFDTSVYKVS